MPFTLAGTCRNSKESTKNIFAAGCINCRTLFGNATARRNVGITDLTVPAVPEVSEQGIICVVCQELHRPVNKQDMCATGMQTAEITPNQVIQIRMFRRCEPESGHVIVVDSLAYG